MKKQLKGLYLVSPPRLDDDFIPKLEKALHNKVCAFQLRLKDIPNEEIINWALKIKPLLGEIPLIINDSPAIALELGAAAAGVHLGADDMAVDKARTLLGEKFIIGASAYNSVAKAMAAQKAGADYICFGAFFETTTKEAKTRAELSLFSEFRRTSTLPMGGIGGITPNNCAPLLEPSAGGGGGGADFIAVSSAIWQVQDISKAIQAFQVLL